jgi:hypothetical protein
MIQGNNEELVKLVATLSAKGPRFPLGLAKGAVGAKRIAIVGNDATDRVENRIRRYTKVD